MWCCVVSANNFNSAAENISFWGGTRFRKYKIIATSWIIYILTKEVYINSDFLVGEWVENRSNRRSHYQDGRFNLLLTQIIITNIFTHNRVGNFGCCYELQIV